MTFAIFFGGSRPDQVIYLAAGMLHGLHAVEDARLLMTIVLPASRTD